MRVKLLSTSAQDLIEYKYDLCEMLYEIVSYSEINKPLYEDYVLYTQEYADGCNMSEQWFDDKLNHIPIDTIMKYLTIDYDSIEIEHEGRFVSVYIKVNVKQDLYMKL